MAENNALAMALDPRVAEMLGQGGGAVASDALPDAVSAGQQYAANTTGPTIVRGGGNTTYVLKPNGQWMQYDNFGPVGAMPQGWSPPPVRAPGR